MERGAAFQTWEWHVQKAQREYSAFKAPNSLTWLKLTKRKHGWVGWFEPDLGGPETYLEVWTFC